MTVRYDGLGNDIQWHNRIKVPLSKESSVGKNTNEPRMGEG